MKKERTVLKQSRFLRATNDLIQEISLEISRTMITAEQSRCSSIALLSLS